MYTRVKSAEEIAAMRESGRMLATVLELLRTKIAVGMTTKELADIAKQEVKVLGGQPSFLGYQGFKDVLCVSVNEEVVHGIPRTNKIIAEGDIVSMDFGVTYKGMITDGATSVIVGEGSDADQRLLSATEAAMYAGIAMLKDGVKIGTIGYAIEEVLNKAKYGIVRDLVGHGVGHELHEDPNIPNYGRANTGHSLEAGMTIAIEPMATRGTEKVYLSDDEWTIITRDHSRAAHFEHTILITETGSEILTTL
jgi:methionyl aminopeptidase